MVSTEVVDAGGGTVGWWTDVGGEGRDSPRAPIDRDAARVVPLNHRHVLKNGEQTSTCARREWKTRREGSLTIFV